MKPRRSCGRAVRSYPESEFYTALGDALVRSGRRAEASVVVDKALALNSKSLRARGLRTVLDRPPTKARKTRWAPYPIQTAAFNDPRKVISTGLLRGYPEGEQFITRSTQFLTLGSCFASNLSKALRAKGMQAFSEFIGENVNSTYANRYFLKWVEEGVQDESGELMQAAYGDEVRSRYLEATKACDVFVFTLGLAPCFFHRETGQFLLLKSCQPEHWKRSSGRLRNAHDECR